MENYNIEQFKADMQKGRSFLAWALKTQPYEEIIVTAAAIGVELDQTKRLINAVLTITEAQ